MISSSTTFRQATLNDIAAIAAVKRAVWPDEPADTDLIMDALQAQTHHTHLALVDDQVAGFVSGFITASATGKTRWEVDLLAVHPEFRRRGLATRLVEVAVTVGKDQSCDFARALIQIENVGSQRSFAQNGFVIDEQVCTLLVCTDSLEADAAVTPVRLPYYMVAVNTLGYSGLWLEEPLSVEAFRVARSGLSRTNATVAGVIIPDDDKVNLAYAKGQKFSAVGKYQRWVCKL